MSASTPADFVRSFTKQLQHQEKLYTVVNLQAIFAEVFSALPVVLRLLAENIVRNASADEREIAIDAMKAWLVQGSSQAEIAFQPNRVLMHDTTSTPALVDIAAMRDALFEAGADPLLLNPNIPIDIAVDHSLAVEAFGTADAATQNMQHELRRNAERYRFLRWAAGSLENVTIHPPGTGIMHTINLEQLAKVLIAAERDGKDWLHPDMMIGTDSHTPMINGIGVLGWGVGGLEAQTVMFGLPTMLRIPEVIGVKLLGELRSGVLATDLALTVTNQLRTLGVTGEFVEFFGPGVSTLTAGDRCVVANMAPEYGATTGYFPVDATTLTYLRNTGRTDAQIKLIETYYKQTGLWFDPQATPRYSRHIEIDLSNVDMHVAGPARPQDLLHYSQTKQALEGLGTSHNYPVAIAAITSCTNTSDPALLIAAGLLARKANALGLRVPSWVKTSLAPGSPAAKAYLERAGLLKELEEIGFGIVGFGCTTCIGNPGPLLPVIVDQQNSGTSKAVAILSGNRNFPGRVHPDIELSFIMSPPLVIAFGLTGVASKNLANESIGFDTKGEPVLLQDIWPTKEEIANALSLAMNASDFKKEFALASANPRWQAIDAPDSARFPWSETSTILRRPPFAAISPGSQLGHFTAYPLSVLGDDVTTDHISPASAIPPDSLVADYLVARGDDRKDLNVFASRRGNWEVMLRAAFHSKTLVNLLGESFSARLPVAHTVHAPSGRVLPLWEVADLHALAQESLVIVAGERYGMGSSRDWAAKGQRLLGVRCVIASSFERIHRSNLIGMGILPVVLPKGFHPSSLAIVPGDRLEVFASAEALSPRSSVNVKLHRVSGSSLDITCTAAIETRLELELLVAGGVIPAILQKTLNKAR